MTGTISSRDRAVLRAVAAGRCELSAKLGGLLAVDGIGISDQFVGARLARAGLIATGGGPGAVRLTPTGRALLAA
ncbi:hypothetical protein [Pseudonocardia acaciae]|uniref:hypothetical protein n=1 Tax=Pseudonocardia acaciae TaxID=551276 RepID=UPI0004912792|nr:hypothetical protein [Pseudonocardia acaciae]